MSPTDTDHTGTADTQLMRAVPRTIPAPPPSEHPPGYVAPGHGVRIAEDSAPPTDPASDRGRVTLSPRTIDELFAELHAVRLGQDASASRDEQIYLMRLDMRALQEQSAAIASGVTALLHMQAPLDESKPLAGKHVLLVEDSMMLAPAYIRMVEGWGAKVSVQCDYFESLKWLDDPPHFDIAVLDVRLPGGSGLDIAERIADEWPNVAIVLSTGFKDASNEVSAAKIGAELIGKPHTPGRLLAAIQKQIGRLQG